MAAELEYVGSYHYTGQTVDWSFEVKFNDGTLILIPSLGSETVFLLGGDQKDEFASTGMRYWSLATHHHHTSHHMSTLMWRGV